MNAAASDTTCFDEAQDVHDASIAAEKRATLFRKHVVVMLRAAKASARQTVCRWRWWRRQS